MYSDTALSLTGTVKENNQMVMDQQVYLKNTQAHLEHCRKFNEILYAL